VLNNIIIGGAGNDTLDGADANDTLYGNGGNDTLYGGSGTDILNGGSGADTMAGGTGNDTYIVDNIGDVVTESAGQGTDLVQTTVNYTLAANVENLTYIGAGAFTGTGALASSNFIL